MSLHQAGMYERFKALEHLLHEGEQSGRELRNKINEDLCRATEMRQMITRLKLHCILTMSAPSFYQMMAEMEEAHEVEGWYKDVEVAGHRLKQRWYKIQEGGIKAVDAYDPEEVPDYRLGWA